MRDHARWTVSVAYVAYVAYVACVCDVSHETIHEQPQPSGERPRINPATKRTDTLVMATPTQSIFKIAAEHGWTCKITTIKHSERGGRWPDSADGKADGTFHLPSMLATFTRAGSVSLLMPLTPHAKYKSDPARDKSDKISDWRWLRGNRTLGRFGPIGGDAMQKLPQFVTALEAPKAKAKREQTDEQKIAAAEKRAAAKAAKAAAA